MWMGARIERTSMMGEKKKTRSTSPTERAKSAGQSVHINTTVYVLSCTEHHYYLDNHLLPLLLGTDTRQASTTPASAIKLHSFLPISYSSHLRDSANGQQQPSRGIHRITRFPSPWRTLLRCSANAPLLCIMSS